MARGIARVGDTISHGGSITSGSGNVLTNGRGTARIGDSVVCSIHGAQAIASGSGTDLANGRGVARIGDSITCGATITSASGNALAN